MKELTLAKQKALRQVSTLSDVTGEQEVYSPTKQALGVAMLLFIGLVGCLLMAAAMHSEVTCDSGAPHTAVVVQPQHPR